MPSADVLRAHLRVAELEEQLLAAKDSDEVTAELKHELRYARWVQRGGPDADPEQDNRADVAHRERYEQEA